MSTQQEKFKGIANKIRKYLGTNHLIKPNDFETKIDDVATACHVAGEQIGYNSGYKSAETVFITRLTNSSGTLQIALRSGEMPEVSSDIAELEDNANQANSDITAIKTLIENHGVEVPVGTLSSTYDETIERIITDEKATGIEQGKKSAYDEFWDAYQRWNGNTSIIYSAQYLFGGNGWNDNTFKPKYSMGEKGTLTSASGMFHMSSIRNVKKILEEQEVIFNFSNVTSFSNMLAYSQITHFPDVVTTGASALTYFLYMAYNLESMGLVTLREDGKQTFGNAFTRCDKLKDISFAGVFGNDVSFSDSPLLTKDSITSIIEHLAPDDMNISGKTLTLNKTAKEAAFTEDEWITLITPKSNQYDGNWTITLV